jgi:nitroreductase
MDFFDLIRARRSVRAYRPETPPEPHLEAILEAVRLAPTAGNLQAFRVKVVTDASVKGALAHAAFGQNFLAAAPWVLCFMADPPASARTYGERGSALYAVQDATIACHHAHLAAASLGLGSVWVGAFDPAQVAKALALPKDLVPVALLPVGYPAEAPAATPRKPLGELLL